MMLTSKKTSVTTLYHVVHFQQKAFLSTHFMIIAFAIDNKNYDHISYNGGLCSKSTGNTVRLNPPKILCVQDTIICKFNVGIFLNCFVLKSEAMVKITL